MFNRKQFILVALTGLIFVLSVNAAHAQFGGGNGSEEDPFLVEDAGQLNYVREYPDAHFRQIDNIDLKDFSKGQVWEPINDFTGAYTGSGFSITNLVINRPSTDNVGLFGYTAEATFGGIRLIDVSILGRENTGSVIGYSDESTLALSFASGTVQGESNIGGLIGHLYQGTIVNSHALMNVEGNSNIGGMAGKKDEGQIENSCAMGNVNGEMNVGGLLGSYDGGAIINSYATGQISAAVNSGGLIGYGNGIVTNSYWDVEKSGRATSAGGQGRTTAEMTYPYDIDTYVGWDFLYRWGTDSDYTLDGYPFLRSVVQRISNNDFAGGTGQEHDPWLIETAEHLNNIRNYLGPHSSHTRYFLQNANINLGIPPWNEGWKPLGEYVVNDYGWVLIAYAFHNCVYYGGNHEIANMFINKLNISYIGLFGITNESYISDLSLIDVDITGYERVGSLVGETWSETTIENVSSTGNIFSNNGLAGGLVGYNDFESVIIDSHSAVDVESHGDFVGGLVGINSTSSIFNCYSTGTINSDGGNEIGGLVGRNFNAVIDSSYSTSSVTGFSNVGGLVGRNVERGDVLNCYSVSTVNGNNNVGGLVGLNDTSISGIGPAVVNSYSISITSGSNHVGGLVGRNTGGYVIENSFSEGEVSGIVAVGGLVGRNEDSPVRKSYSICNIIGNQDVGGLVGYNFAAYVENSYSMGSVSSYSGYGGLVGTNDASSIINCYSTGVTGTLTGGLVGFASSCSDVVNSYWDKESSGALFSSGGEGKTTREMLQSDSYDNWDFNETWKLVDFNPYMRKHYPALQWQGNYISHNRIDNFQGQVHRYRNYKWQWRSFPRLEQQDDHTYTANLLLQLEDIIIGVEAKEEHDLLYMYWDTSIPEWLGDPIGFHSARGYKLKFADGTYQDDHFLHAKGERIPLDTPITLQPNQENWIGYFVPRTQCVFYAFGSDIMDQLQEIKTDEWGMYRMPDGSWKHSVSPDYILNDQLAYGKMYSVVTSVPDSVTFIWNLPPDWPEDEEEWHPVPRAQFFTYNDGPDYESFFIEEIADDEDVLEVGIYAGDECVGAAVFFGSYPMEILAYTNASHTNEIISFAIYRESQRGEPERIHVPQVMNNESGEYSSRILQPGRQRFTIVRLEAGDEETDTIIKPEVTLSQNYPNPFVYREGSRSSLTEIPFYVAVEREVTLTIYNIRGQQVRTLYEGIAPEGYHSIGWNGLNDQNRSVGSGVYFYRLESVDEVITRKMLLVR